MDNLTPPDAPSEARSYPLPPFLERGGFSHGLARWASVCAADGADESDVQSRVTDYLALLPGSPRRARLEAGLRSRVSAAFVEVAAIAAEEQETTDHGRRVWRADLGAEALLADLPPDADFVAELASRFDLAPDDAQKVASRTVWRLTASDLRAPVYGDGTNPDPFSEVVDEPAHAIQTRAAGRAHVLRDGGFEPPASHSEDLILAPALAESLPEYRFPHGGLDLRRRLRAVDFDSSLETRPPSWLIKGLLIRSGVGMLYGESSAGKTFLAIHAALCVAWGLPFFGRRVKQGAVVFIAAEGGAGVIPRFKAAEAALMGAISAESLARKARGLAPLSRAPIRIVTEAPNLSRTGSSHPLVATIEDAEAGFAGAGHGLAMVVVDTWHAVMGGGEENSAADTGEALRPIVDLADRLGFLALLLHHPGKDLDRGARGSNSLPAAMDATIELRVPGSEGAKAKSSSAMRQATVVKLRDGETGGTFNYRLPVVQLGEDEDGDPWTTCVVEPCAAPKLDDNGLSGADREVLEAVDAAQREAGDGRAKIEVARLRFYNGRPEAKAEARRKAWTRGVERLRGAGRLEMDPHDLFVWKVES